MSGEPTLEKGISSDWVAHLQELMRDAGYWQGDVNGTFDDDLEQAVQIMQDNLGLQQTGVADDDTWSALQQQTSTYSYASTDSSTDASTDSATDTATDAATDTATDTSSYPTLSKGISSDWVLYLQQVMQVLGVWGGATDGSFGDDLEQAVQALQGSNGLQQTGVVDGQTWDMLANLQQSGSGSAAQQSTLNPDGTCPKPGDISEAEDWIIQHESGWNPNAKNPSSSAFGLGQLLKENRVKYLGDKADSTDCDDQISAFRGYVKDAYGTAERAKAFWQATSTKDVKKAPADLQGKAKIWIDKGWVGY